MELFEADLAHFATDWRLSDKAESTIQEYLRQLRKYNAWCAERNVQTLSMHSAKAWLVEVKARSISVAYLASRAIKAFGRWYENEEYGEDPFKAVKFVKQTKTAPQRTASVSDVAKMLLVCGSDVKGLRDRALISVLAATGMRRSEVGRMAWSDIDFNKGGVVVPLTKSGHSRTARLDRDAQRALRRYSAALEPWELDHNREPFEEVWVSTSRRCPLSSNGISQVIAERARQAGVDISSHSFRRGFAVRWLRLGGSESYLREVAGWESPRMVSKYVRAVASEEALAEHERLFG